jgi:hypothetical protein
MSSSRPPQPAREAPDDRSAADTRAAAAGAAVDRDPAEPGAAEPSAAEVAEAERVAAVRATGLVGVEAGERLDRIARQVALVAGAPIAMISLVDADRQWNPGVWGAGAAREAPREMSMCSRAIESPDPYVVPDTAKDPEWADNPGVAGPPDVRFYAGQPIDDGEGHLLGVLCVVDFVPREADEALLASMRDLAVWARHELLATSRTADAPAADTADAEATATHERLEELERLQSLVVSTTAHQLRTPLTVLRVHAELLQDAAGRLGPDERASLEAISGAVSRLQTASDDLVSDLRGNAGGAEEALRRWLKLDAGSGRIRPLNEPEPS